MEYYYVPSWFNTDKLTHIIDEGHIDTSKKDDPNLKIIGVNWYSDAPLYDQRVFILDSSDTGYYNVPQTQIKKYKNIAMKADTTNTSGIYGYQEKKKKNDEFKFHLINKLDGKYNAEMEASKKTQRRGAVCGTAKGAKNKPELIDLINKIIESMGIPEKSKYDKKNAPKKTDKRNGKINLCEEIEILLRHRDSSKFYNFESDEDSEFQKVSYNHRYFYRMLEKAAIEDTEK